MIKSAKRAIYAVLQDADVNDEELHTTFVGVEDLLNSRPITYQSSHPADELPLTPNHFLHGRVGGEFAAETVDTVDYIARKRWRRVQELVRHVWSRWMKEWLPELRRRRKWQREQRDFVAGDHRCRRSTRTIGYGQNRKHLPGKRWTGQNRKSQDSQRILCKACNETLSPGTIRITRIWHNSV